MLCCRVGFRAGYERGVSGSSCDKGRRSNGRALDLADTQDGEREFFTGTLH